MLEATDDRYHKTFYNSKDVSCPPHPGGSDGKDSACNSGDTGDVSSIPCLGDSLERKWLPIPLFLPGKSHGQRNLAGYSPRGHNALNTA